MENFLGGRTYGRTEGDSSPTEYKRRTIENNFQLTVVEEGSLQEDQINLIVSQSKSSNHVDTNLPSWVDDISHLFALLPRVKDTNNIRIHARPSSFYTRVLKGQNHLRYLTKTQQFLLRPLRNYSLYYSRKPGSFFCVLTSHLECSSELCTCSNMGLIYLHISYRD